MEDGCVYLPGDKLPLSQNAMDNNESIVIGPGFRKAPGPSIISYNCGVLRKGTNPCSYWIDTHSKRYIPVLGDHVIGIISSRLAEGWKVDIGSADLANLSSMAFEGASKRNRPNLKVGDIVYAVLSVAIKDMEPELSCVLDTGKSSGLGAICTTNDGFIFTVPLNLIRKILSPKCDLIKILGSEFKFEITIGMNGRIWIKSSKPMDIVTIMRVVKESPFKDNQQIKQFVCQCVAQAKHY